MVKLYELLKKVPSIIEIPTHKALNEEVKGISTNSHSCKQEEIFIGMPGTRVDGGEFWQSAIKAGAVAVVISPQAAIKFPINDLHCVIIVEDVILTASEIATAFYSYPSEDIKMIGVTGTNGKTTTTHLIEYFLSECKKNTALIGTLYSRWNGFKQTSIHTTPFSPELQAQLSQAVIDKNEYCVIEVSSHALVQGRVKGCGFNVSIFTNLTQDHLDFHKNLENYFLAKQLLFSPEYLQGKAVVNIDDSYGERLIQYLGPQKVYSYSIENTMADFHTTNLNYKHDRIEGILKTPGGNFEFQSPLVGKFNLSNLLAAIATLFHLNIDLETVINKLPQFPGVPGRVEKIEVSEVQDISVIVDYAHTPDSLENLLKATRPFISGKVICVFGCGGDRDRSKRSIMGKICAKLADISVLTSDNPRTEEPEQILSDILEGVPKNANFWVISNRTEAIKTAILKADPGDGVLIVGKGHENYQILGTEKIYFDDREQATESLKIRFQ